MGVMPYLFRRRQGGAIRVDTDADFFGCQLDGAPLKVDSETMNERVTLRVTEEVSIVFIPWIASIILKFSSEHYSGTEMNVSAF